MTQSNPLEMELKKLEKKLKKLEVSTKNVEVIVSEVVQAPSKPTDNIVNALSTPMNPLEKELNMLEKKLKKLEGGKCIFKEERGHVSPPQPEFAEAPTKPTDILVKAQSTPIKPLEKELKMLVKKLKKLEATKGIEDLAPQPEMTHAPSKPIYSLVKKQPTPLKHLEKELKMLEKNLKKLEDTKDSEERAPQPKIVEAISKPTATSVKNQPTTLNPLEKELHRLEKKLKKLELEDKTKEFVQTGTNPSEIIKTLSEPQESIATAQPTPLNLMEKELKTLEKKLRKITKSTNGVDCRRGNKRTVSSRNCKARDY